MATRADLPRNEIMDEHRREMIEIVMSYLQDKTSRDERKEIVKEALKEWLDEQALRLGWFSFRFIIYVVFAAVTYLWLAYNGWHK